MRFGLRSQLVAYTLLLTLTVGGGFAAYGLYSIPGRTLQAFEREGTALTGVLGESLIESMYNGRIDDMRRILSAARRAPDINRIYALDIDGRVLSDGTLENPERSSLHRHTLDVIGQALSSSEPVIRYGDAKLCMTRTVAPTGGRPLGLLHVEFSLQAARDVIDEALLDEALFFVVLLILCCLFAVASSGRLVSPIIEVAEGAREIGAGRFGHRVSTERRDELGQLAAAINQMAVDLCATTVSKNFFDGVIRALPTYLLVLDADCRVKFANPALIDAAGKHEKAFDGVHINQLLGKPDGEPVDVTSSYNKSRGIEATLRMGDDREVPVSCRWSVVRNPAGKVEQVVFVAEDLSELKAARAERERFFSISPDVICVTDFRGYLRHTNQAWLTILGPGGTDSGTRPLLDRVHPDHRASTLYQFRRTREGQAVHAFENRMRTVNGEWRWFAWYTIADQKFKSVYATGRDVTERRQMEEALISAKDRALAADRAKSAFLANMSHELRTPLNAIIGYSEMLEEDAAREDRPELEADLRKIHSSGRHLLTLINDVLDLSKIEAGRMQISVQSFEIADAVAEVADTVRPLMEKGGNGLVVRCASDAGVMHGDLTRVRQILFNLLSNAAKFTSGGTVVLSVERGGGEICFEVEDDGIGIGVGALDRIFEPFSQADATTTREYGGTGLGLAITRRLCDMLGGRISARSTLGEGSTFSVTLPQCISPAGGGQAVDASEIGLVEGRSGDADLVLVIDDDPASRERVSGWLGNRGYRVAAASGGEEGLELARRLAPALIALDLYMADADGWSVLRSLKADPALCRIPVVMCTMTDERQLARALGAADYLIKPLDREQPMQAVESGHAAGDAGCALVVEDDSATRGLLARTLHRAGWRVSEAADGAESLERLDTERADVILLDLMMPRVNGFQVLEALRGRPSWSAIPVVVFTAMEIGDAGGARLGPQVQSVLRKGEYDGDALIRTVNVAASDEDTAA